MMNGAPRLAALCRAAGLGLLLLVVGGAPAVLAGPPPPAGAASQAPPRCLQDAKDYWLAGLGDDHVRRLAVCFEESHHPAVLAELGSAYERSGNLQEAIRTYRRYQHLFASAPDAQSFGDRADAIQRDLDTNPGLARVAVRCEPAGAAVFLPGRAEPVGYADGQPIRLPASVTDVRIGADGYAPRQYAVRLVPTETVTLEPCQLEKRQVILLFDGLPERTEVRVDDEPPRFVDGDPFRLAVDGGAHRVRVRKPHGAELEASIAATEAESIAVSPLLRPLMGEIAVPHEGQPVVQALPSGDYEVSLVAPDQQHPATLLRVRPGETVMLSAPRVPTRLRSHWAVVLGIGAAGLATGIVSSGLVAYYKDQRCNDRSCEDRVYVRGGGASALQALGYSVAGAALLAAAIGIPLENRQKRGAAVLHVAPLDGGASWSISVQL